MEALAMRRLSGFHTAVLIVAIVVFTFSAAAVAADTQTTLYTFTGYGDGGQPEGGLIADADGNLYGTTAGGGAYYDGTVFELSPNGNGRWTETVLYSFAGGDAGDGSTPLGIVFDGQGNIFGLTQFGGTNDDVCNCGTVFELSPNSNGGWAETVLYTFVVGGGLVPMGAPALGADGSIYSTTSEGGEYNDGVIFQLSRNSDGGWTYKTIFDFSQTAGRVPLTGVILDSAGSLYGVAQGSGGPNKMGKGTVYRLSKVPWGWTYTLLYTFQGPGGAYPLGNLVFDSTGNLYGTTSQGGATNNGTVFEVSPTTKGQWKLSILHDFTGGSDGGGPWAGLTIDSTGNLYGVTAGSSTILSTAFELSRSSAGIWKFQVLADLPYSNGYFNLAPFLRDAAGNLYNVMTGGGGGNCHGGCGFVYELSPNE
jgi:uncharacterized repeat protein (TIGR03803 family)